MKSFRFVLNTIRPSAIHHSPCIVDARVYRLTVTAEDELISLFRANSVTDSGRIFLFSLISRGCIEWVYLDNPTRGSGRYIFTNSIPKPYWVQQYFLAHKFFTLQRHALIIDVLWLAVGCVRCVWLPTASWKSNWEANQPTSNLLRSGVPTAEESIIHPLPSPTCTTRQFIGVVSLATGSKAPRAFKDWVPYGTQKIAIEELEDI